MKFMDVTLRKMMTTTTNSMWTKRSNRSNCSITIIVTTAGNECSYRGTQIALALTPVFQEEAMTRNRLKVIIPRETEFTVKTSQVCYRRVLESAGRNYKHISLTCCFLSSVLQSLHKLQFSSRYAGSVFRHSVE